MKITVSCSPILISKRFSDAKRTLLQRYGIYLVRCFSRKYAFPGGHEHEHHTMTVEEMQTWSCSCATVETDSHINTNSSNKWKIISRSRSCPLFVRHTLTKFSCIRAFSSIRGAVPTRTSRKRFSFMRRAAHWHSLLPSQTGSNAGHYAGPTHWPSPRCCCGAPPSDAAERGGALMCGQSLFLRR